MPAITPGKVVFVTLNSEGTMRPATCVTVGSDDSACLRVELDPNQDLLENLEEICAVTDAFVLHGQISVDAHTAPELRPIGLYLPDAVEGTEVGDWRWPPRV